MSEELFPNAPLVRAIFEARFPGDTAIEVARSNIQQEIRPELPNLFVPRVSLETAPALQAYVFRSQDESESLEIAINRVNYVKSAYRGYADFRERALHFLAIFRRHVPQVKTLNRVGLRYVNHIPLLRDSPEAAIQLADYVNIGLVLPSSVPSARLTELNSVFSVGLGSGTLRVLLKNESPTNAVEPEKLILDFDFGQQNDLAIDELSDYLDIAHQHTKQVFQDLISPKYLPVMRGENV